MRHRVVIVGAGVTGLLTAVRCALAGHEVVVVDRGAIPNPWCTSSDQHRAIRALDAGDAGATRRVARAHDRWLALESLLGTGFYRRVGVVSAFAEGEVDAVLAVAAEAELSVSIVEPDKLPHITFPAGTVGVQERDAGVLLADRVLKAAADWLGEHPNVTLRPGERVRRVDDGEVVLPGEILTADLVVVAAGPWSRELVDLPMVLYRQTMVYLRPPEDLLRWWENAPSAGRIGLGSDAWLLPPGDGTLLKISTNAACREVEGIDDDDNESRWAHRVLASSILPELERYTVAGVKRCHYLVDARTRAGHLVRLGPRLVARSASGGDGFRTAPLVADRIVEDLREEGP